MRKFNFRIGSLEVRSCNEHLLSDGEHSRAEIINWAKGKTKTIARWIQNKEGYDLQFVGGRPFNVDSKLFMQLAKQGQQLLDDEFNSTQP